ncbi:lipopolysaccharide biosynthesis protein [Selenomonas ruminantium]|uniref:lipopolysaccharide biosynthesis protein n=1 Tax=Selenomonas ruminantium TaxID=971 RepID=UPI0003FF3CD3|nr:oligosaccharide flippase family protein [Selenomonas ruminantium]
MNKFKLFIENFLVYGLGSVISKVIPLIMLPIITRLMPDPAFYGLFDLSNTITSFGTAIAILGMYDAMFRYFFEKDDEEYRKDICSTAFIFTLGTSIAIFLLMILFEKEIAVWVFADEQYGLLVYLTAIATLLGATNGIISAPTRMQNKRKVFLVTNTLSPIIGYTVSIPLLLAGHYLVALPLAGIVSSFLLEGAFAYMNRQFFSFNRFHGEYLRNMLKLAVPLAPTFLVYWVFNSADRLMISNMIGVQANGIYSIGSKLGMASQFIYQAFAGGWQYFAFSTMKEKNQVESNSKVFEYLGIISFISCMFICTISKEFYELIFTGEYVAGYIVSPYLFLSPLLLMLYQVIANQFLVVKKTWPGTVVLTLGALSNVVFNYLLIPILGVEGAGIATLCGYVLTVFLASALLIKMHLLIISKKFLVSVGIMALYFIIWRWCFINELGMSLISAVFLSVILLVLYRHEFGLLMKR